MAPILPLRAVLITCAVAVLATTSARAQDAASLRAAIEEHYSAIHGGEGSTVLDDHLPEFTMFASDGRVLLEAGAIESAERMGTTVDFGTGDVYMSDFHAQMFGEVGVATFYLTGRHTLADETKHGTWRVSAVWVWQGDGWKEAHHHESPLEGELRP